MTFEVIPVLDLMGGVVVRAHAGERERYRPLAGSALCAGAEPAEVIEGFLRLHPFRTFYIADLDAITGRGGQNSLVRRLEEAYPDCRFWVDAGFADALALERFRDGCRAWPVLGSESQTGLELLEHAAARPPFVLSLDYAGNRRLGPAGVFERTELWPPHLIVMTLARVGTGSGPDLDRLARVAARAPGRQVYAAGGVRGLDDLLTLHALPCAGALVASALHDGRIGPLELARLGSH